MVQSIFLTIKFINNVLIIGSQEEKTLKDYQSIIMENHHENLTVQIGGLAKKEEELVKFIDHLSQHATTLFTQDLICCYFLPEKYLYLPFSIGDFLFVDYHCKDFSEEILIIRGPTEEEWYNWEQGGEHTFLSMLDKVIDALKNNPKKIPFQLVAPFPCESYLEFFHFDEIALDGNKIMYDIFRNVAKKMDIIFNECKFLGSYIFPEIISLEDFTFKNVDFYSIKSNKTIKI